MMALRLLAAVAGFVLCALALLPLRFAVAQVNPAGSGLDIADARGTIWRGGLSGLSWQGAGIGDVAVSLQPLRLISGQAALAFESGGPVSSGVLAPAGAGWAFDNLNGRIALANVAGGMPPEASVYLTRGAVMLDGGGCKSAAGVISIDGLPSPAPARLEGELGCDNGQLTARLASPEGGGAIDARITIGGAAGPAITATSGDATMQILLDMANIPSGAAQ